MAGPKVVCGGGTFSPGLGFPDVDAVKAALDVLETNGVNTIDTAQIYGQSEELLGKAGAGPRFIIDTKWKGGFGAGNGLNPDALRTSAYESLQKLGVKKVDIFYVHAPDPSIRHEEWLPVVNELHKEDIFQRFGLSNFRSEDVQSIYDHCKQKGFVVPSVYQGNYSPVARLQDTVLFPTLRKLNISFYAYSPLAGGFLTKTKKQIEEGAGRFSYGEPMGVLYRELYAKPAYLDALADWEKIAESEGCSKAELAYRWVSYHSPLKEEQGDAIIIGASSLEQLEQTLNGLKKGPLKSETAKAIDEVWEKIKHEAPLDNYHSAFVKIMSRKGP